MRKASISEPPWGAAYSNGGWTTLAFVEHENTVGLRGLLPSVRKLLDYRSDVLRMVIGYSGDLTVDLASDGWRRMIEGVTSGALGSIIVAIIECKRSISERWHLTHFADGRLQAILD